MKENNMDESYTVAGTCGKNGISYVLCRSQSAMDLSCVHKCCLIIHSYNYVPIVTYCVLMTVTVQLCNICLPKIAYSQ